MSHLRLTECSLQGHCPVVLLQTGLTLPARSHSHGVQPVGKKEQL